MTEKQMDGLAERIVQKMIILQQQYDEGFKADINSMIQESGASATDIRFTDDTDIIKDKILLMEDKLEDLLSKEQYDEAHKLHIKIMSMKEKYNL